MKIYRMDKSEEQAITSQEREEQEFEELIREEQLQTKNIKSIKRKFTNRLTKEINIEINNITFSIDNISRKLSYLKEFEASLNNSIFEKILFLSKTLKMINYGYLGVKEEEI